MLTGPSKSEIASSWQILCPVWPQFITSLNDDARKTVNELVVSCSSFSVEEGTDAVTGKYKLASIIITSLEAEKISVALGNDPLLIGLHDVSDDPVASRIIQNFIDNRLVQLSNDRTDFIASEYLQSILTLFTKMFDNRNMQPLWSDIQKYGMSSDQMKMIRNIASHRQIFWLVGDAETQSIIYRHDRVRDWFAAKSIAQGLVQGTLSDNILSEPYFARVIGSSLNLNVITPEIVDKIKSINPLALFHSLQDSSVASSETQKAVISCIEEWLQEEDTHSKSNEYLRWECINILSLTDSPHVLKILEHFRDKTWSYYYAGFRNGDLGKGIELCSRRNPGIYDPIHEQLLDYVITKNRREVLASINDLLRRVGLSIKERSGILRLCGYIGDSALSDGLQYRWENEIASDRILLLADYFWACAHCCGESPNTLLDPIFDAWASLPGESENKSLPSDRDSFGANEVRFAFQKYIPSNAIEYFITQADRDELRLPITYLLDGIDHPSAVVYSAHYLAKIRKKIKGKDGFSPFLVNASHQWTQQQERQGRTMSGASKTALSDIWREEGEERHLRIEAFRLWAATHAENDNDTMKLFKEDEVLYDWILRQRVIRKDIDALPQFIENLQTEQSLWHLTRYLWSDELIAILDKEMDKRPEQSSFEHDDAIYNFDSNFYQVVMRLPADKAESFLINHWEQLRFSSHYVQVALFVATDKTVDLARDAVNDCPDPKLLFKYIRIHQSINNSGRYGITTFRQMEVMVPYLDFLTDVTIHYYWELCNERGWFDFRQRHFDQRMNSVKMHGTEYLSKKRVFQSLNDIIKSNKDLFWFEYSWVDDFLKTGASAESIINIVYEWVKSQAKIGLDTIAIALIVLVQIGDRHHYFKLLEICSDVQNEYRAYFENAFFRLKSRQLH